MMALLETQEIPIQVGSSLPYSIIPDASCESPDSPVAEVFTDEELDVSPVSPLNDIHQPLLIFDWDDTLLPTSFLTRRGLRLDGPSVSVDTMLVLERYADSVRKTLISAAMYGKVVIVTNAESGWINLTVDKFMPSISSLVLSFPIVSARSTFEPLGLKSPFLWKERAFDLVVRTHYQGAKPSTCRNVISFGDSLHEREAVLKVCLNAPDTWCKSLMFIERPDVDQLSRQHTLIQECLSQIVDHPGHLDLCVHCNAAPVSATPVCSFDAMDEAPEAVKLALSENAGNFMKDDNMVNE
jgi:hypothetical protein